MTLTPFGVFQSPNFSGSFKFAAVVLLLSGVFLPLFETPRTAGAAQALANPIRWAYYVKNETSVESVRQNLKNLDILSPFYFSLNKNGQITGKDQPEVTGLARGRGVKVVPMVQNNVGLEDFHNLISKPDQVKNIIDQIDYLIWLNGYDGFQIDFENVSAEDRPLLTQFMAALYARLKPKGKLVTMAVAAKARDATTGWAGSYDYTALAPNLDLVTVMTYDYSFSGGKEGPVAPINWVNSVAVYAAAQFGASKILLGIPFYGYDWNLTKGGQAAGRGYQNILDLVQKNNGTQSYDENYQSPFADYTVDGDHHRVWFENTRSISTKMDLLARNNLAGWAAWRMGQESPDFWPIISTLANPTRAISPIPNSSGLVYFKETGHSLGTFFLKYWQKYGVFTLFTAAPFP